MVLRKNVLGGIIMAIGYACLTIGVMGTGLTGLTLKNATKENLNEAITNNLSALAAMTEYNEKNGIKLFRISSDLIPFGSHPVLQVRWWEDYKAALEIIGQKMKNAGIRVSMHPGQYTVLNSPESEVVHRAIKDLEYHDHILTSLGMKENCKLILHTGGVYGDKKKAMKTFMENYAYLPDSIKRRLVIENDDKSYTIEDVLWVSDHIHTPVVFDNLHHRINPPLEVIPDAEWIKRCSSTWKEADGKQKIHYSQQKNGGPPGSHSDTIKVSEFLDYYHDIPNQELDIMLEVKDKNLSAVKCIHTVKPEVGAKALAAEWERYQYLVRSRSQELYQDIITLLETKENAGVLPFYELVEKGLALPENKDTEIDVARLIWNSLKDGSTKAESKRYEKLMEAYIHGAGAVQPIKNHLLKCAKAQGVENLLSALYFYIS
jgi:UV DNA damage endonuclease